MSIFNFFKQRKKLEEPIVKNYNLENLPVLIEEEVKNINDKSEKFKNELKNSINHFSLEIKQKIPELKMLNLDKRREEQRLKDIVMKNFHDYILYLEKLIEDLEKIEPKETEKYVKDIQSVFNHFSKNSGKIYEKATILIGKELAEVRDKINNFAKEFNEKLILNKENFERMNLIKAVQDNLRDLEEAKKIQKQIENSIADLKRKIVIIEEKKQLTKENYEQYKKGNESKKFIEEQEKIKQENEIINEDVLKLKQDINLKDLAKYFHNNLKKSNIIKEYSENFYNSLKEDSALEIIQLLKEANQAFDEEKIKTLRQRILGQKNPAEDTKIKKFNESLLNLDSELKYELNEIEKEKEKIIKFEEKQKQILTNLEKTAQKIWKDFKI